MHVEFILFFAPQKKFNTNFWKDVEGLNYQEHYDKRHQRHKNQDINQNKNQRKICPPKRLQNS